MVGRLKLAYHDLFYLQRWQTELIIEGHEIDLRDRWECERAATWLLISPHLKKNSGLTPEKIWPLPWDLKKEIFLNMENIDERIATFKKHIEDHKKRVAQKKKNGKS